MARGPLTFYMITNQLGIQWLFWVNEHFYVLYFFLNTLNFFKYFKKASLSCACGDTLASELGSVIGNKRSRVFHLVEMRMVPRGANGGMSFVGTLGKILLCFTKPSHVIPKLQKSNLFCLNFPGKSFGKA